MAVADDDHDPYPKEEGEWFCQYSMRIDEVRMLYNVISSHIDMFPGPPHRPIEELEYCKYIQNRLFAMMTDFSFTNIESHVREDQEEVDES